MDAYSREHLLRAHSAPGTPAPRASTESRAPHLPSVLACPLANSNAVHTCHACALTCSNTPTTVLDRMHGRSCRPLPNRSCLCAHPPSRHPGHWSPYEGAQGYIGDVFQVMQSIARQRCSLTSWRQACECVTKSLVSADAARTRRYGSISSSASTMLTNPSTLGPKRLG